MQDDEITLYNTCTDLVTLKKAEAFPRTLLGSKRPGEWISVRELCLQIGVVVGELGPNLFATWLTDPLAHDAYAVIMFYEDESKWSMAAHYNGGRLFGTVAPSQEHQPPGTVVPPASCPTAQQAASAAER